MKIKTLLISLILLPFSLFAKEGIWLPYLLQQLNEPEMKEMGMRISASDIYDINKTSIKDAIVQFGGGCTGEVVSDQGLLLTNHHCGYGSIQRHSSLAHDYLTNGFWSNSMEEELPNPGLTVTFLVRMEDVTKQIIAGVKKEMTEAERNKIILQNSDRIAQAAIKGTHYEARVRPFYYGNQYILMISETFRDIRLVGAPPSNIGKFGGDTDNWMWPRHTGDFSIFRIYADKNGNPADYAKTNIPYKPKYSLPISLKGVNKGDFTFVFGYPGRTQEYIPSQAVQLQAEIRNPVSIKLRDTRLNIMNEFQKQDPLVRIQYAAKNAGIANGWKKMIGESKGIKRLNGVTKKQEYEKQFTDWVNATPQNKEQYGKLLPVFADIYAEMTPLSLASAYFTEGIVGSEAVSYADGYAKLVTLCQNKEAKPEEISKLIESYKRGSQSFFKDYYQPIDKKIFANLIKTVVKDMDSKYLPPVLAELAKKYKDDYQSMADKLFEQSFFTSQEKVTALLNDFKQKDYRKIIKDPLFNIAFESRASLETKGSERLKILQIQLDSLQRIYMKAQIEMQPDKRFYPDANSTLRVAYGKVDDYKPADGIRYQYFTTLDGIMEKENPDVYDYVVEKKLKHLYKTKDFGPYADKDGSLHVGFIASNHTTGGNSGSPVLDADGNLLGLNFDRNWEGTMSDLMYDPDQCRNITLDIRYCLFIIDKFAGAKRLINEMKMVQ
ncbi:MAG: S46 family peptidase [Bacteroidetes bacterium]|nr:S46 family peptidase [Bacteroidota bacterium]